MTTNLKFYQNRRRHNIWLMYCAAILVGIGLGNVLRFWLVEDSVWAAAYGIFIPLPLYVWLRARDNMNHWQDQIHIELGVVE